MYLGISVFSYNFYNVLRFMTFFSFRPNTSLFAVLFFRIEPNNEYYDGDKDNDKENEGFLDV